MNVNETPKTLHFLWLNREFNGKGEMNPSIQFFKDRITSLHPEPEWKINFINDPVKMIQDIEDARDYNWIFDVIKNPIVGAAHKSDVLRFFYLYTQGGAWIDITTFLVEPIDDLIQINNKGFTCYYMPQRLIQSKMMGWEFLHNLIPYPDYVDITNGNINKDTEPLFSSINPKYENYQFIPENYFIISRKEHPICKNILDGFETHYKNMPSDTIENVNDHHNKYMYQLMNKVFNNKEGILKELNYQMEKLGVEKHKETMRKIFSLTGGGSYLFNYLMMFEAIADYSIEKNLTTIKLYSDSRENVLNYITDGTDGNKKKFIETANEYNQYVCDIDSCRDILLGDERNVNDLKINDLIEKPLSENEVYLMSAQYIRLTKWSDSLVDRLKTWDNTPIKPLLTINTDNLPQKVLARKFKQLMKELKSLDVTQIKFSSWTSKSPMVKSLKALLDAYQNENDEEAIKYALENTFPKRLISNNVSNVSNVPKNSTGGRKTKSRKSRKTKSKKSRKTKSRKSRKN